MPEYWVVNVAERQVEVHTEPVAGVYTRVAICGRGARFALREFPEFEIAVSDFIR